MANVTLKDIATKVGYSKNTVSLALRDDPQLPPATRERIRRVAGEMGYQPNAVVSQLMAQLRARNPPRFQAKLALVNANRSADAFRRHPTIPAYVEGCQRQAAKLGYGFDQFWLHAPDLKAESWLRILRARNIKGIVLSGLMDTNRLPAALAPVWAALPTVVTGVRTREPALSFSCVDHHHLALTAVEKAISLGYRRPALVLDDVIDQLVERRFSAGFMTGQKALRVSQRVPAFTDFADAKAAPDLFHRWRRRHKPDALCILYNDVLDWLKASGVRVPADLAVIQLEWRATRPQIAGMNQHNDITGEAAVDMLISQIHNHDRGVPAFPRATLIGATWMDGASAPSRAKTASTVSS
jgi:LacI family transcriptional regulator